MGDKITLESIDARLDNIEKLLEKTNGRSVNNAIAIAGIKGFTLGVPILISTCIALAGLWWKTR